MTKSKWVSLGSFHPTYFRGNIYKSWDDPHFVWLENLFPTTKSSIFPKVGFDLVEEFGLRDLIPCTNTWRLGQQFGREKGEDF